ncbi:MAG: hypothetical protein ACR2QK_23495, partial [Acidimicrobiales bacterium]
MTRFQAGHYRALSVDAGQARQVGRAVEVGSAGPSDPAGWGSDRRPPWPVHPAAVAAEVGSLTVVYDGGCALCQRCRMWVLGQPQ